MAADSALIQSLIDEAEANGGGHVWLEPITYTIDAKVAIPSKVQVHGAGIRATKLQAASGLNDTVVSFPANAACLGSALTDLHIDGDRTNQTAGDGVLLGGGAFGPNDDYQAVRLENLRFTNCYRHSMLITTASSGSMVPLWLRHIESASSGISALAIQGRGRADGADANVIAFCDDLYVESFNADNDSTGSAVPAVDVRAQVHFNGLHVLGPNTAVAQCLRFIDAAGTNGHANNSTLVNYFLDRNGQSSAGYTIEDSGGTNSEVSVDTNSGSIKT